MTNQTNFLDHVYEMDGAGQTRALYGAWAESYDADLKANRYASPGRTAAALATAGADKGAPLLDLGCGTGLSGEAFRAEGFTVVDGTDFSEEMLEVARSKGVYRNLVKGDLNAPIPARPGDYANIAAVGVFSPGHAPAPLIDEVVALLPAGGCFGFTLNDHALEEGDYVSRIEALVEEGKVEVASDAYGDHLPGIGLKAKICVLRKR